MRRSAKAEQTVKDRLNHEQIKWAAFISAASSNAGVSNCSESFPLNGITIVPVIVSANRMCKAMKILAPVAALYSFFKECCVQENEYV